MPRKKVDKKLLEATIKEEIIYVQEEIKYCQSQIKNLKKDDTLFPFWNCRLHIFEQYQESLENL